jgi:hypothetical protein
VGLNFIPPPENNVRGVESITDDMAEVNVEFKKVILPIAVCVDGFVSSVRKLPT